MTPKLEITQTNQQVMSEEQNFQNADLLLPDSNLCLYSRPFLSAARPRDLAAGPKSSVDFGGQHFQNVDLLSDSNLSLWALLAAAGHRQKSSAGWLSAGEGLARKACSSHDQIC